MRDSNPGLDILAGCCHSNAHISLPSGPGEQQNPGEKTLPLESRLRYTSGWSRLTNFVTMSHVIAEALALQAT